MAVVLLKTLHEVYKYSIGSNNLRMDENGIMELFHKRQIKYATKIGRNNKVEISHNKLDVNWALSVISLDINIPRVSAKSQNFIGWIQRMGPSYILPIGDLP